MNGTVLVADDHAPTRAMIREALEEGGFTVCAEVPDGPGAVEVALAERPDVCLLDINMPGNGIAAAREIRQRLPETAIVMLTISRDDDDLFDALKAGADGYLLKDVDPRRLPLALQGVLDGEAALPRTLTARLIQEFGHRRDRRLPRREGQAVRLTPREWEVLELMREGMTTSEIAGRMYVSPVTVRTHVSTILKKLRVSSREEALRLLATDELDEPPPGAPPP